MDKGGGSEDAEQWLDVKLELAWHIDGLTVVGEAKGGIKNDASVFESSCWMDRIAINWDQEDWGLECGVGFGGKGADGINEWRGPAGDWGEQRGCLQ